MFRLQVFLPESTAITNRVERRIAYRNSRRHIGGSVQTDWEAGLREATHQTLVREGVTDPHLRGRIYTAPLIGRQDNASPFGDIIVVARGQVYSTDEGYKFVQDPYQNDCDDCHNKPNRYKKLAYI